LIEWQTITDEVTARFGVDPIRVTFNPRFRSLAGRAHATKRHVEIGAWMLYAPDEDQRQTLLHEIAHVLTGPTKAAHGREWKSWMRRLGVEPERTYSDSLAAYSPSASRTAAPVRVYFICTGQEHSTTPIIPCEIRRRRKPRNDYSHPAYTCKLHGARFVRATMSAY